jgi:hypothetical protein
MTSRYQLAFVIIWVVAFFGLIFPFVSSLWGLVIVCFGTPFGLAGVRRWERSRATPGDS